MVVELSTTADGVVKSVLKLNEILRYNPLISMLEIGFLQIPFREDEVGCGVCDRLRSSGGLGSLFNV